MSHKLMYKKHFSANVLEAFFRIAEVHWRFGGEDFPNFQFELSFDPSIWDMLHYNIY